MKPAGKIAQAHKDDEKNESGQRLSQQQREENNGKKTGGIGERELNAIDINRLPLR